MAPNNDRGIPLKPSTLQKLCCQFKVGWLPIKLPKVKLNFEYNSQGKFITFDIHKLAELAGNFRVSQMEMTWSSSSHVEKSWFYFWCRWQTLIFFISLILVSQKIIFSKIYYFHNKTYLVYTKLFKVTIHKYNFRFAFIKSNKFISCICVLSVCGHVDLIDFLQERGAKLNRPDSHNAFPLHYAAQMCGSKAGEDADPRVGRRMLQKLLQKDVDVDCRDQDKRTPLIWAASSGKYHWYSVDYAKVKE